jgi:hypothetical protein
LLLPVAANGRSPEHRKTKESSTNPAYIPSLAACSSTSSDIA